jgi:uncharacterized membrane protein YhaH (DUF805 family)
MAGEGGRLVKVPRLLFSFRGRIVRGTFWQGLLLAGLAFLVLYIFLETELGARSTLVLYPFFFWVAAALAVKRMRDRGRSPWWLLTLLVPIIGPLWLFVELGLRHGTPGENQYGADPREIDSDYLTVDISRP